LQALRTKNNRKFADSTNKYQIKYHLLFFHSKFFEEMAFGFAVWRGMIFAKFSAAVFLVFSFVSVLVLPLVCVFFLPLGQRFESAKWLAFAACICLLNTSVRSRERMSEIKCFHSTCFFAKSFQI